MVAYKKARALASEEAAYLAGLIDGEGSVSLHKRHRNENRQLVISISNTEKNILAYVQEITGVGKITNKRTYQANHTLSMTYVVSNRQALSILKQVAPYLKSYKADRAALLLENYLRLTPRNGKYSAEWLEQREAFSQQFLSLRPNAR